MINLSSIRLVLACSVLVLVSACHTSGDADVAAGNAMQTGINGSNSPYAQTYGASQSGEIQTDSNGRVINAMVAPSNQTYYFSFDQSGISADDMKAINIQADYLVKHRNAKIRLEGNTDARGSREYNVGLGWRRDQSVARILEQQGVSPDQIEMVSYGKERPAAHGDAEDVWSLNRRVNLVYETTA